MNQQKKINAYCEAHTTLPVPVLYELERETHLCTLSPQMISGRVQGHLLTLLASLARPKLALEVGTFTGYASICIAKGLPEGGMLHTIEINPELAHISRKYFEETGLADRITAHQGDAKAIIPALGLRFDFVFMDAAKFDYQFYYELLIERLNIGGLLIADNVLWGGKVVIKSTDSDTMNIDAFNKMVNADPRVENLMLPVRDGILVVKKLG
ncbi:MAG: O-methyltransferase [Saprospiraceae bacterium]|nr:O-methyltransferase [Saprospiraceae bacterium]MCF8250751.1 O-methyltransferase [Saprospiraceae bacterium]MCF8279808.1 O-methyltransferase [Bacteroidales bacterium]MCF8310487.1 O-methyltransferase [Saprospiraceae bacterium]MCF8440881.1 O-methyltransferase [Saprospiraceae bacterium]